MKCPICKTPIPLTSPRACLGCGYSSGGCISPPGNWNAMATAPVNAKRVKVILADGTIYPDAHFAMDLSGEEQPPFIGWFVRRGRSFCEISTPVGWLPMLIARTNHGTPIPL